MTGTGTGSMGLTEQMENMTPDQAVKMVRELCAQLVTAGTDAHGNIWPGNVNLDEAGTAALGEGSDAAANERSAGQVEYLAPETFWDNAIEPASDVYSLGMMLYTACNGGYLPFQPKGGALTEKDRSGALRKRMKGEVIRVPSGTSRELAAVIRKALSYEPEDRYQSPAELLSALGETDEALPAPEYEELAAVGMAAAAAAAQKEGNEGEMDFDFEPVEEEVKQPETDAAEEAPAEAAPAEAAAPAEEKRYSVQKDFEKTKGKTSSAAPATRQKTKKKTSPAIPILCVAAAAVIAGTAYYGVSRHMANRLTPEDEVSETYVVIPAENPETTLHPAAEETAEPEATAAPEAAEEPSDEMAKEDAENEEEEKEAVTGSPSIDGMDVTAASDTVYITGAGVNLRTGPGTSYQIAKTLNRGTELQLTGTVNGWSQVQYEGEEYYVSTNLVSTEDPLGEKRPADSTAADSEDKTESNAGTTGSATNTGSTTNGSTTNGSTTNGSTTNGSTTTNAGTTTNTGAAANTTGGTSTGSAANTTPAASTTPAVTATRDILTVTGSTVNLRKGPGTNSAVVTTVPAGTVLQRTGTTNGWSRVVYKGEEVYISDSMTKAVDGSEVVNTVGTLKVTSDVNVRSASNTGSSILGVVKAGQTLPTTGITDGGKWYRVSYNGKEGYVNRKLVSVEDMALVTKDSGTVQVTTRANVRSGPATDYTVLGVAEVGENLQVTGLTDNNWYEVSYNDKVGYISASLVKK